jgi:hypothetical protein
MGMCFPAINVGAMGAVTGQELGLASGLLNTSRQIGAGLGIALLVATMAAVGSERFDWAREELRDELNDVYELPTPLAGALLGQTFGDRAGLTEQRLRLGPGFDEEVARLSARATRTAYAWGFRGAAVFVLLAIPLARTMRRTPMQARAAEAAAAGAAGEVGVGLLRAQPLDRALEAHLAPERLPVQGGGRPRVGLELAPLARAVVREEADRVVVDALQEHDADRRPAVRRGRGERHPLGLDDARGGRLLEPVADEQQRVPVGIARPGVGPVL